MVQCCNFPVAGKSSSHWHEACRDGDRVARPIEVACKSRFDWREASGDRRSLRRRMLQLIRRENLPHRAVGEFERIVQGRVRALGQLDFGRY